MHNTQTPPMLSPASASKCTITAKILNSVNAKDVVIRPPKVVRLGNERDEVFLGDVLTFAAVTSFQVKACNGVPEAFCIDVLDNGDLGSLTNNALCEPEVAKWLADNFSFKFSLKNESGRREHDLPDNVLRQTAMPWVRILDTSGLTADLLDIEVTIEVKPPPGTLSLQVLTTDEAVRAIVATLNDVVERIGETQGEVRRLHECLQRFAAFQETVDWTELIAEIRRARGVAGKPSKQSA